MGFVRLLHLQDNPGTGRRQGESFAAHFFCRQNRVPRHCNGRRIDLEHSKKRITDVESSEALAVLEILGEKDLASRLDCGGNDQGVVPGDSASGV
jgi:hypothetical protein